jgi:uncharacterized protein
MIAVVLDSNVYISALLFGGIPRRIIELAELGLVELYSSKELQAEVKRVLIAKFRWPQARAAVATAYLESLTRCIRPKYQVNDCSDPDDNRVLECAIEAKAKWVVTGDQHLLALHPYRNIAIVTPRQFLESEAWKTLH